MTEPAEADGYARLFEAFEHARALGADERNAYVAQLREEQPKVAAELQRLLDAEGDGRGDAFDTPAIEARGPLVPPTPDPPDDDELPASIGPFAILRLLGRGGMGVVYEAEQDEPRRRVALKLVHSGLAFGERLTRFRREAEVLARLQHPGIAQIHATGTVDLGTGEQPYFVMELVQGDSLLAHAEREELSREQRVQLVARVCDAVQHAHERGVVHRDLKPDNILVDERGRPKVLDFGIARLTDDEGGLATMQTAHGAIIGTLTHMAPEQLSGEPDRVGPQTDVYALGVIAFQLLAGRLPHNVSGLSATSVVRRLLDHDAPRLGSVERSLRGDLETIVGKALEGDPARRYPSAEALGADLRRHLAHEPVAARAPSALYRAGRFARRHRGLVAGTSAAMLALVAGVIVAATFAVEARKERREAEAASYRHVLSAVSARLDHPASDAERALLLEAPEHLRDWEWEHLRARTADPSRVMCEGRPSAMAVGTVAGEPAVAVASWTLTSFTIEVRALDDATLLGSWQTDAYVCDLTWTTDGELTWVEQAELSGESQRPVWVVGRRLPEGEPRILLEAVPARARSAALSADGSTLVRIVQADDGVDRAVLHDLRAGTSHGFAVDSHAEGARLDTHGQLLSLEPLGRGLLVLDAETGAERLHLEQATGQFDPASDLLVVSNEDRRLSLWDMTTQPPRTLHEFASTARPNAVSVTPARDALVVLDRSGLLTRIELDDPAVEVALGRAAAPEANTGIRWARDGRQLVTASSEGVRVWDGRARTDGVVARHESFVYAVHSHAGQGLLASAGWDGWAGEPGCLRVQDLRTGAALWQLGDETAYARDVVFSAEPDLAVVGVDGAGWDVLLGLDPRTGAERWRADVPNVESLAVAPAAAGQPARVAAYNRSGQLALHAAQDGRLLWQAQIEGDTSRHTEWNHDVAWSPDGQRLAVTAGVTWLALHDARDGQLLAAWDTGGRRGARVSAVAFSPDGELLASASEDHTVTFWDPRTGAALGTRLVHDGPVLSLAFHPSGRRLATGGRDGAVRIWSVDDARELLRLQGHESYVQGLHWADEGATLLSASGDGTVRRWGSAPVDGR